MSVQINKDTMLAGILEPVFTIRRENDLGIGDTESVRQMIDWCARHHLNIFQTLPINELSDGNSPYDAISSMGIEPSTITVSPEHLPDLTPAEFKKWAQPQLLTELRQGRVHYPKVKALKGALLEAAFDRFLRLHWRKTTARAEDLRRFVLANDVWLSDYAFYRALMVENANVSAWERWPPEHGSPARAHSWLLSLPEKRREELIRRQHFFCYVQWIAYGQWEDLKSYAGRQGVLLMGDIPFGVGRCSADVWANRDIFDLDWNGGAPPERTFEADAFTTKWGQNWGIPNYRWDVLRRRNFDWWRTRIDNIRRNFHLYRIDHALGFFRIYSFPWTPNHNAEFLPLDQAQAAAKTGGRLPDFKPFPDDTPEHKESNQNQGDELLRFVLEASGDTEVIAEDLGVVPDYVPMTLRKLGIAGFRIPMFLRAPDGSYSDPAKYPRLSLTQPATHDHQPLAAAWAECWSNIDAGHKVEENQKELHHIMEFAGLGSEPAPREFSPALQEAFLRRVVQSNSRLVVVMISDVFGQTVRFNSPGTVSGENWSLRMDKTVNELDQDPVMLEKAKTFARLVKEAGRGIS